MTHKLSFRAAVQVVLVAATISVLGAGAVGCAAPQGPAENPEESPAEALLARSIAFHDPAGHWGNQTLALAWNGTGAEGEERSVFDITIYPDAKVFRMNGRYQGSAITYELDGDVLTVSVDGAEPDGEARERLRLGREGGMFWRDYFGYLAGLPMKLRDPGTLIDPGVTATDFMGRQVQSIRVTYEPEVGGDTWYFYFDPTTAELVGCRFYHDESANDGEYITFEGLIEADGLRLPQRRRWYMNVDDRFLGEDVIERLELGG